LATERWTKFRKLLVGRPKLLRNPLNEFTEGCEGYNGGSVLEIRHVTDSYTSGDTCRGRGRFLSKTRDCWRDFDAEGWPSGRWRWSWKPAFENGLFLAIGDRQSVIP